MAVTWNPKANDLFLLAVTLAETEQRVAFLDSACDGDVELRRQVEALLSASAQASSLLEKPAADLGHTQVYQPGDGQQAASLEGPGTLLSGRYRLLEVLGEGGMGTVYIAEQIEPVRRQVALKIVKAGMDSKQVVARFEAERQALALMDHPNIARVLDAGTTAIGRPYFVMELVNGVPITRFCDAGRLSPRERLELFIPVCQAVQHAHQKGIIHRDLKPSNVLVGLYDGRPVPKVIDFGLAKAVAQELDAKTVFTGFGAVVGTPEYMAPEQAELHQLDVDTRCDVYALGVLLYELLTGSTPFERKRFESAALLEVLRVIREEEPPRPSQRLSSCGELAAIAATRQMEPTRLKRLVRGELDWIIMKALEKDRNQRYDSATALAADVERFLRDEPVLASPPSATYRLRKFVRRHRGQVIAAALVVLALVGASIATVQSAIHAHRLADAEKQARQEAEQEQQRAEAALYGSRVALAQEYWQNHDVRQARRLLDTGPPAFRAWEWYYLDRLTRLEQRRLSAQGQFTTAMSLSRDGKHLAAFSNRADVAARVWDLTTTQPPTEVQLAEAGPRYGFSTGTLHPGGNLLAVGERSGRIMLWDVATGKPRREVGNLGLAVNQLAFSPNGQLLAAAGSPIRQSSAVVLGLEMQRQQALKVWNVETGEVVFAPDDLCEAVVFSPDGQRLLALRLQSRVRLASFQPEYQVTLWRTATWKEDRSLPQSTTWSFSGDGRLIALAGRTPQGEGYAEIVDARTGAVRRRVSTTLPISALALRPDGRFLAIASRTQSTLEIHDLGTGPSSRPTRLLRGHEGPIKDLCFTPDGTQLIASSEDETIRFWDITHDQEARLLPGKAGLIMTRVAIHPNGRQAAWAQGDTVTSGVPFLDPGRQVLLTDLDTGISQQTLRGSARVRRVAFAANGARLITGDRAGQATTWDLKTGQALATCAEHTGWIEAVALSADGQWAASSHVPDSTTSKLFLPTRLTPVPGVAQVWNAATAESRFTLTGHPSPISQLAFSPKGNTLASACVQEVRLWDANSGTLRQRLSGGGSAGMVFSPEGTLLAVLEAQQTKLIDVATGETRATLTVPAVAAAFTADGRRLATAQETTVKLWDVSSGQEILTLTSPSGPYPQIQQIAALQFAADGSRLLAARRDGMVHCWETR